MYVPITAISAKLFCRQNLEQQYDECCQWEMIDESFYMSYGQKLVELISRVSVLFNKNIPALATPLCEELPAY